MDQNRETSWWSRPCGGRDVLAISLPLIVSTASWSVMHFTDRMFLAWFDKSAMAASMPAGILHFTLVCFPLGIATYVNTFVAQYQGAGRPHRIGAAVWQGVGVGVVCLPFFLGLIPIAPWLFQLAGHKYELAGLETTYFQIVLTCSSAEIMSGALSSFFTGRGSTKTVMIVDTSASALNILLDYLWVFGYAGFPRWGIAGAAWATVVSQWFRVAAYLILMLRPALVKRYQLLAGLRYDRELMRRLLRYGGPNGLQMFLEVAFFALFLMLVGRLGENAMAATTLAFSINTLAFIPMLGLGIGLTTIVGHQLGQDRPEMAARATWTAFRIAALYMGAMAAVYVLIPDVIMLGHAAGMSPGEFAAIRDLTVELLRFVAVYCLFDAMNVIFVSTLKGAGDTRFILWVSALVSPPPVLIVWAGIRWFDLGILWSWTVITLWICALGMIYGWRYLQGHWRTMRVIEPDVAREEV